MTPAAALAKALLEHDFDVEIITDRRGLKYKGMFGDLPMMDVPAGAAGAGLMGKVKGAVALASGVWQSLCLMTKNKPACVVGFGGYPSVPAVLAAQMMGIPTLLHEQNAIIGKANAFLAARAKKIAISLPDIKGLSQSEEVKVIYTGNPVRPEIEALRDQDYAAPKDSAPIRIVVVGGSLGATVLSEVVPETLKALPQEYRARLSVLQQCRESDLANAQAAYEGSGIQVDLVSFIDDMAGAIGAAHLVIGRSGASTVSELTVAGRPAIFVPYPFHKDQQQKMNAQAIADHGGAWVISESSFTVETLKGRLELLLQNPSSLKIAADKAKECGKPDAAKTLASLTLDVIKDKS